MINEDGASDAGVFASTAGSVSAAAVAQGELVTFALFPNPVVAESLLDRLISTSHQVIMIGPSYRPIKRPRNATDKAH
ncbi:hypothetical protein [Streptomyces sp. NBC_01578]|uniref:hypothetical protein n=1 Tax=Streptomyces sp. NBC_01578 TaxID=2975884 RepID=UPI00386BF2F9